MGQDNSKQVDSPDEWDIVAAPEEHFEHYLTHDVITKQHSLNGGEIVVDVVDKRSSRDSFGPAPSGSGDLEKVRGKPTPTNGHHHHRRRRRSLSGDSSSSGSSKEDVTADPLGVKDTRSSSKQQQQQQQQVMQGEGDGDEMWDGIPAGKFEDEHALNQYQSTIMHEVKVNYDVRNSGQYTDESRGDYDYTSTDPFIAEQTCQACHKPVADMDKLFVDTTVYHKQCFRWEDEVQEEVELEDTHVASQSPHPAAEDELIQWGDNVDMPASSANHHRISSTSSASLQRQRHSSQLETDSNKRHTASFEFTVGQGREVTNDKEQSDQPAVRQRSEVAINMASPSASIQLHNHQSVAPIPAPPVSTESYTYEDEDDEYNYGRSDNREEGGKNRQGQGYPRIELGEGRISENEPIVRGDVIRETDQLSDPTPPSKMARNMADKFETMTTSFRRVESQRQPLPAKKDFKWNVRESGLKKPTVASQVDSSASPASGYEDNNCDQGQSQAGPTDMPPANLTRSLLSKFQNQTAETRHLPPPSPARAQQQVKVAAVGSKTRFSRGVSQTSSMSSLANSSAAGSNERIDGVMETSLNLDYEDDIQERHLYFGEPTEDADTAASSCSRHQQQQQQEVVSEVPEQGTTRNLLAKFQSMQNSTRKK